MTNSPMRMMAPAMMAAALLSSLSGCVSFGGKPPAQLLSLTPDSRVEPGTQRTAQGGTLTVMDPEAPKKLDTVRIPVQVDATSIAYVKDAQWVDTPRRLFQKLLSETISARNAVIVLDPGQYSADPGRRLLGELVDFGIDARTGSAIVTFDATLAPLGGGPVSKRRFSASVPVGPIEAGTVGGPINAAANRVATDVAAWVGGN